MSEYETATLFVRQHVKDAALASVNVQPRRWSYRAAQTQVTKITDLLDLFTATQLNEDLAKLYAEQMQQASSRQMQMAKRLQLVFVMNVRRAIRANYVGIDDHAATAVDTARFDWANKVLLSRRIESYSKAAIASTGGK